MSGLGHALVDGSIVAKRNLIKIKRVPEVLVYVLITPIMFVLLFAYVFGASIEIPGVDYREYLVGGVFAQTVVFGAIFTGAGLAEDAQKGIIDRFRSLPMARSAVLVGRTASDVVYNVLSLLLMSLTGLLVGWRLRGSLTDAVLAYLLLLVFAYAFSWVLAYVGLRVPSVEVVNNAAFVIVFPLTFVSNAFVDASALAGPLRTFAYWNPISAVTQATRNLFGNTGGGAFPVPEVWSLQNPVLYTLIWVGVILVVFVPLSVRRYNDTASD